MALRSFNRRWEEEYEMLCAAINGTRLGGLRVYVSTLEGQSKSLEANALL